MVQRFIEFHEPLLRYVNDDHEEGALQQDIAALLPSYEEVLEIKKLYKALKDFQDVSLSLQKDDGNLTFLNVRHLFDNLIADYGNDFKLYLSPDSDIIHSPFLESAIVQALNNEDMLNSKQREVLRPFELVQEQQNLELSEVNNYAKKILQSVKCKRQRLSQSTYVDLSLIPTTTNIVERFFSHVKLNLTTLRNSLLPRTLEAIMFLKMNKLSFNSFIVQEAMKKGTSHI